MQLKTQKKGMLPNGGGQVHFSSTNVRELTPIQLIDEGDVKKIRGIAYSTRVTPQTSNRIVESGKKELKPFTSNVYIHTDHYKGKDGGLYVINLFIYNNIYFVILIIFCIDLQDLD